MEKLIKRKKLMEKLVNESYNALDKISNKLDVRTTAAYRKKFYASNRIDTLEKYIKSFNDINNKQHEDIITIGKIKQEKKLKNERIRIEDTEIKNTKKILMAQL